MKTITIKDNEADMYIVEEIRGRRKTRAGKFIYKIKWKFYPESQCTWEPIENLHSVLDNIEEYDKLYMDKKNEKNLKVSSIRIKNPKEKIFERNNEQKKTEAVFGEKKGTVCKENTFGVEEEDELAEGPEVVELEEEESSENSNLEECQASAEIEKDLENESVGKQSEREGTGKCNINLPYPLMKKKLRKYEGLIRYNNKRKLIKKQRQQNENILILSEESSIKEIEKDPSPRGRWSSGRRPELFCVKIGEIEIEDINKNVENQGNGSLTKLRNSDNCKYQSIVTGLLSQYKANEEAAYSNVKRKLVRKKPCLKKSLKYRGKYQQFFYTNPDKIEGIKERKNKSKDFKLVLEALEKIEDPNKIGDEHAPRFLRERPNLEMKVSQSAVLNFKNNEVIEKTNEKNENKPDEPIELPIGKSSINREEIVTHKKRKYVQTHERWSNYRRIRQEKEKAKSLGLELDLEEKVVEQKAKPIQKKRKYERRKPASEPEILKVGNLNKVLYERKEIIESIKKSAEIEKKFMSEDELQLSNFLKFRFKQPFSFEQRKRQSRVKQTLPNLESGSSSSEESHETWNKHEEFKNPKILMKQFSSNNPVRNLMSLGGQDKFITNFEKYSNNSQFFSSSSHYGGFRKYQEEETPEEQSGTEYKQPVIKIKEMHRRIRGPYRNRNDLDLEKVLEKKLRRLSKRTGKVEEVQNIKNKETNHVEIESEEEEKQESEIYQHKVQVPNLTTKKRGPYKKRNGQEIKLHKIRVRRPYRKRKLLEDGSSPIKRSYFRKSKYRLNNCDIMESIKELEELMPPVPKMLPSEELEELSPLSVGEQLNEFNDCREYRMQIGPTNKLEICLKNSENKVCEVPAEELEKHYTSWIKMFYESFI